MEGRGLGRAGQGRNPGKGVSLQGQGGGPRWGSESSAHRVPSHRNSVLLQPSANVELHYASHGAKGQLLPLGLETPIAAAVQFGPDSIC